MFGIDTIAPGLAPWLAGGVLVALFVGFLKEVRPPEVLALGAAALFLILGLIDTQDVLGVLSNPAPATIAAMFVMSAALVRTGALDVFIEFTLRLARGRRILATIGFLFVAVVISAFVNNTPVVLMLIPVAVRLSDELGRSPSKLLIPLSYAAILGGTCSMIGTSTNILVDGMARDAGLPAFHLFEIAPLGLALAAVGVLAMLALQPLLPSRPSPGALGDLGKSSRFMIEALIPHDSPFVGKPAEAFAASTRARATLVDVIREGFSFRRHLNEITLAAGDIIVLRAPIADILTLKETGGLALGTDEDALEPISSRASSVVEVIVGPGSPMVGRAWANLRLRRRYGVYALALHRRGENLGARLESEPLAVGDTILLEGAPEGVKRFAEEQGVVNVVAPRDRAVRTARAPVAAAVIIGVIVGAALGIMPIAGLAVIGAAVVLLTRCVDADEAFKAIDGPVLVLIFAMLAIGAGLEKSGVVDHLVAAVSPTLLGLPPIVALAAVYLTAMVLTEVVTNNAVAIVVTPVAIALAQALSCDPRPFVVAVMFAASASFATPIGYQTNTLVYAAGGYRFADFLRIGIPMNLICAVVSITLIPLVWPLNPAG